jgi:septum formation protein
VAVAVAAVAVAAYHVTVLYLASQSPQRALLLARARVPFTVVPSSCDEEAIRHASPELLALERARGKARGALIEPAQLAGGAVVIAADTVVALAAELFGKPADRADARRILGRLSGTTHAVSSGHCCVVFAADGTIVAQAARLAVAHVTMRPLSAAEIGAYVDSGESDGRAGAYAIQEHGDRFITALAGSWDTVVGLNLELVARLYRECTGLPLPGCTP